MAVSRFRREYASDHPRNIRRTDIPFFSSNRRGEGFLPLRGILSAEERFLLHRQRREKKIEKVPCFRVFRDERGEMGSGGGQREPVLGFNLRDSDQSPSQNYARGIIFSAFLYFI
jgi:hypothetical protein